MPNLYSAAVGIHKLEMLASRESPVHSLHPMAKIVTTAVFIVAVISFPFQNISGLVPFLFFPLILLPLSGTPVRVILGRLLPALPFAFMVGLGNIIVMRGAALHIGAFAVSGGMLSFVSIMLKTTLAVTAALILTATTPFDELCRQLYILRLPPIFCLQFIMTFRYLSVLTEEAFSMSAAYALRSGKNRGITLRHMGILLGQLILRSFDRADRVYRAMKCRGFDGTFKTGVKRRFKPSDAAYTAIITAAALTLRFFNLSLFIGGIFV
jgi:cobalt/nickel transport system permease protein